jgi:hypothetical protein
MKSQPHSDNERFSIAYTEELGLNHIGLVSIYLSINGGIQSLEGIKS